MTDATVFGHRVAGVFGARVVAFAFAVTGSLLMSRWLDRTGQGGYTTITTVLSLIFTFGQIGLPSAVTYYAGRGRAVASLLRSGGRLVAAISVLVTVAAVVAMPIMLSTIAQSAPPAAFALGLLAIPILLAAALGGGVLYGLRDIRVYTVIQVIQAVIALLAVVALVGLLGLGVTGAIAAYLLSNAFAAVATIVEARRLLRRASAPDATPSNVRELVGYGARLYPSSITSYFNYRADVLLLNVLRVSSSEIGLYGRAVNFAEIVFYVPDSISAIFYPTVAASTEGEAHRIAPAVARLTVLVSALAGIALLPVAYATIEVVLPRFSASFLPLVILVPGIVSLSLSKVLSSYISGLGRPGAATIAASVAMATNLVANLLLIPIAGITGAAMASLISYSLHAAIMVAFAARVSRLRVSDFILPGSAEIRRLRAVLGTIVASLRQPRSSTTV